MCEADLEEEVSRTGKWGRNKISETNGIKKDAVHWINAKKRSSQESRRGTLALRYRERRKAEMDKGYSTSPRTATRDAAKLHDDGNANATYRAKPQNNHLEDNQIGERGTSP